jgi:glycosyltransferase involved in cell wall biosynthesis
MTEDAHIAILLPSLDGGGAEKVLMNLAEKICNNGYCLDLLVLSEDGPYADRIPKEANVISLHSERAVTSIPELVYYLLKNEPDSLLTSLQVPNIVAIASKYISQVDTKVVVRVANVNSEINSRSIKHKAIPYLIKIIYRYADTVIAISNDVKIDIVENYNVPENNIMIINNPSFSEQIIRLRKESPRDRELFEEDTQVVLGVGRLAPQKNFQTLIQAFSTVYEEIDAKLVILGEGKEKEKLVSLTEELDISDHVIFPGFVNNPYSYMYRSSVFVLPSLYEGFPNVLVEALACQCPIVATDCPGGSREILDDGTFGELVATQNPERLAERIQMILTGKISYDREKLEDRAREFGISEIYSKYINVLIKHTAP